MVFIPRHLKIEKVDDESLTAYAPIYFFLNANNLLRFNRPGHNAIFCTKTLPDEI